MPDSKGSAEAKGGWAGFPLELKADWVSESRGEKDQGSNLEGRRTGVPR